jgi:hypothetical protein
MRAWVAVVLVWLLVGCGNTPPAAAPLITVFQQKNTTTVRIAAVIIDHKPHPQLSEYVIITPENPPQFAPSRMAVTLTDSQYAAIPWRDDNGVRYAPIIIAGTVQMQAGQPQLRDVSDIDTTMREQTVANLDYNRIVRVIGLLNTHPDGMYLHDRSDPAQSRAFRPAWRDHIIPLRLAEGALLLVEAVRSDEVLIPLVLAPVVN